MIYRINLKNYLVHMIDYFPLKELTNFQYVILSSKIQNNGSLGNVATIAGLYPPLEMVVSYYEHKDLKLFEKEYLNFLSPDEEEKERLYEGRSYSVQNSICKTFLIPLQNHFDILILYDKSENFILDVLCKFLKKNFKVEVANLNELFEKGEMGKIYLDRDEIKKCNNDIIKRCGKEMYYDRAQTHDGRKQIIETLSTKEKLKKLKHLGVRINESDKKNINNILLEVWDELADEELRD